MGRRTLLLAGVLTAFIPLAVGAQEDWAKIDRNKWEMTASGSGSSDNEFDSTGLSAEASVGYYFTRGWEVALRQGIGFSHLKDKGSNWNGSTRLALDYNMRFGLNQFRPYLGINIGYLYGEGVSDQFIAGPEGGLKLYLNSSTFLLAAVEYQILFRESDKFSDQFDDGRFVYTLGLGYRW